MRILHTSDWHFGKKLEAYSRLEEQKMFTEELKEIVKKNKVDMIIISGDVYDTANPPAEAEKLFYDTVKELSDKGKRPIIVISGNHDSPERLSAAEAWGYEQGIIILGNPKSKAQEGKYEFYSIIQSGEGWLEIEVNGEKAVVITMPYPSEKRLKEIINEKIESEEEESISYSNRIGEIFNSLEKYYRDDTINLLMAHLFMLGGETTDSERPIQLGGSLAVSPSVLPEKAQYIALGHLHKPQKVTDRAYYSGSPIQYSKSEINYSKSVYLVDVLPGQKADIEQLYLKNYKPIEVWDCESVEKAIEKCETEKDGNSWVFLNVHTQKPLTSEELNIIKTLRKDIISIEIITKEEEQESRNFNFEEKSMAELFGEYYFKLNNTEIPDELRDMFIQISEGDLDETDTFED